MSWFPVGPVDQQFQLIGVDLIRFLDTWGNNLQDPVFIAIYNYARLVQRIFYLQDPNKSRRRELLLPNTHAKLVAMCQNAAKCHAIVQKILSVIDAGGKGFPHNPAERSAQLLFIMIDKATGYVVTGESLIIKNIQGKYVIEMWGVAVDPFYLSSGAWSALLLATLGYATSIVQFAFGLKSFDKEVAPLVTLELQVPRNSFPFIEFVDRFAFYARNGFAHAIGDIKGLYAGNQEIVRSLAPLEFRSKYIGVDPPVMHHLGNDTPLTTWQREFAVFRPTTDILFKTKPRSAYIDAKILDDLVILYRNMRHTVFAPPAPKCFGILSHSGYVKHPTEKALTTFRVPAGIEIIIMNSPGYNTYTSHVSANWYTNAKYFRAAPIEVLKKLFPPFKSTKGGISIESAQSFIRATSGGILMNVTWPDSRTTNIQIHCYAEGDFCPDLVLQCKLGKNTDDLVASMFGEYDVSFPTEYKDLAFSVNPAYLDSIEGLLFSMTDKYAKQIENIGRPNKQYRIWPAKEDLLEMGTDKEVVLWQRSLDEYAGYVAQEATEIKTKIRLCIFSCGTILVSPGEEYVDDTLQKYNNLRTNHTISLPIADYDKYIGRVGECIYDLYNLDVATLFSPATPRSKDYSMRSPSVPRSRGSRKASKGSRGSRKASKGSQKTKSPMSVNDL